MKFAIACKAVPLNQLLNKHWTVVKKAKDELAQATWISLLQGKFKPLTVFPVTLCLHLKWKQRRRHDLDAVLTKQILDQMVRQGLLPDDNLKYVGEVRITGETGADRDEIIVEIKNSGVIPES